MASLGRRVAVLVKPCHLCQLLSKLGFDQRAQGSHHIFRKAGIEEKINLQRDGSKAKVYQVRQVRTLILKYKLEIEEK